MVTALDQHGRANDRISASVVTYRTAPEELSRLLDGLTAGGRPVDITVVDNSPSDDLCEIATGKGALYLRTGRNLGFGGGHNLALNACLQASRYHIIVNPDIYFTGKVIESLYHFMEDHPDVGWVMPRIENPDGTDQGLRKLLPSPADLIVRRFLGKMGEELFRRRWTRYQLGDIDMTAPCEVPCLSGCFMFLRTSVLKEVGLFDERFFMYMEDVDLCRRVGRSSRCVYYPCAAVTHGYAKGSYVDARLFRYHIQSAFRYFSKWGWFFDAERKRLNRRAGKEVACPNRSENGKPT
jgi:GT2 family glycosyltransferase